MRSYSKIFLKILIQRCEEVSLSRLLLSRLKNIKRVTILESTELKLEFQALTFQAAATVILGNIGKIILG